MTSMNMPNGAGYARQVSSVININQGGGEKKAGLINTVDRRYSSVNAEKNDAARMYQFMPVSSQVRPIGMLLTPAQNIMP